MSRYNRQIILSEIGQEGQDRISRAKVLVIGAGGLGCPVLQYLAAAGIGTLGIVDFDVVEESNLQRQILFGVSSLGQNKALAAKSRLLDLNPTIHIETYTDKFDEYNSLQLLRDYDIVVDCTDNFETRYIINDASVIESKPVVYGAIYKFEGQVSVFNFENGPSYRCLFPSLPEKETIPNCSEIGVLGVLSGIIGTMQANEVLKIVLKFKGVLSGELLCYNAKSAEIQILKFSKSKSEIERIIKKSSLVLEGGRSSGPSMSKNEISFRDLKDIDTVQLVDVREPNEEPKIQNYMGLTVPFRELESRLDEISRDRTVILFCQQGLRSKKAVDLLRKHNINNTLSLREGAYGLIKLNKIDNDG